MNTKNGVVLDQHFVRNMLFEIYQRAYENEALQADQVIYEMVTKLKPYLEKDFSLTKRLRIESEEIV